MRTQYYVQSLPYKEKFYHHAIYPALKKIAMHGQLIEGKPYGGISMTTDVGRYTSPLPIFKGICCVDGFVEFPIDVCGTIAFPVLYRTGDKLSADECAAKGYRVFEEGGIPPEYKHIMPYAVKNFVFLGENEWKVIEPRLFIGDYKVYIADKQFKRMRNSLPSYQQDVLRRLSQYGKLPLPVAMRVDNEDYDGQ